MIDVTVMMLDATVVSRLPSAALSPSSSPSQRKPVGAWPPDHDVSAS